MEKYESQDNKFSNFFIQLKSMARDSQQNVEIFEKYKLLLESACGKTKEEILLEKQILQSDNNYNNITLCRKGNSSKTLPIKKKSSQFLNYINSHNLNVEKNKENYKKLNTLQNKNFTENFKRPNLHLDTNYSYTENNHFKTSTTPFNRNKNLYLTTDDFIKKQIQRQENINFLLTECSKSENKSKKLEKDINHLKFNKFKKFKFKVKKSVKKFNGGEGFLESNEEIKSFFKTYKKTKSDKKYLVTMDENKAKVISTGKNNIFERCNFVKKITDNSAYQLKSVLTKSFLGNSFQIKENNLHFNIKRDKTLEKQINLPLMQRFQDNMKRIVYNTDLMKKKILNKK